MGARLIINLSELLQQHCPVTFTHYGWQDGEQVPVIKGQTDIAKLDSVKIETHAIVQFGTHSHYFDVVMFQDTITLECDFSTWGSNFKKLSPLLQHSAISYRVVN